MRNETVGGRKGWRAPSIEEIQTLVDPDQHDPSFRGIRFGISLRYLLDRHSYIPKTTSSPGNRVSFSGQAVTDQKSGTRRLCVCWARRRNSEAAVSILSRFVRCSCLCSFSYNA